MCRVGDIIVVKEFKDKNGIVVPRHSFVVINDDILSMFYDNMYYHRINIIIEKESFL